MSVFLEQIRIHSIFPYSAARTHCVFLIYPSSEQEETYDPV